MFSLEGQILFFSGYCYLCNSCVTGGTECRWNKAKSAFARVSSEAYVVLLVAQVSGYKHIMKCTYYIMNYNTLTYIFFQFTWLNIFLFKIFYFKLLDYSILWKARHDELFCVAWSKSTLDKVVCVRFPHTEQCIPPHEVHKGKPNQATNN